MANPPRHFITARIQEDPEGDTSRGERKPVKAGATPGKTPAKPRLIADPASAAAAAGIESRGAAPKGKVGAPPPAPAQASAAAPPPTGALLLPPGISGAPAVQTARRGEGSDLPPRPSWDEYFLKLAMLASERATCPRMHCGCVFAREKHVLATGYNGALPGLPHCDEAGCLIVEGHCVRTNHAEMNALCQATHHGVSLHNATAYVTNMPCTTCAKALIAAGIIRVVVFSDFHDTLATQFFRDCKVKLDRLPMPQRVINYNIELYPSARRTDKSK